MTRVGIRFYLGPDNALAVELHPTENPTGWVMRFVNAATGAAASPWFVLDVKQLKAARIAFTHALDDLGVALPSD